ncbi:Transposase IS4 [Popillia japonica]|uniref:Transposase IS4 n=1 Tax=Popillia japonica TaxID=7064 RepID=A0AAW1I8C6_POPJA
MSRSKKDFSDYMMKFLQTENTMTKKRKFIVKQVSLRNNKKLQILNKNWTWRVLLQQIAIITKAESIVYRLPGVVGTIITKAESIVYRLPGVVGTARESSSPIDIWGWSFTDEMLNDIVENTNKFISSEENGPKNRTARPTDLLEEKALLGLLYLSGEHSTIVSYIPRKNKNVLLFSTMHHDDKVDKTTGKPELILMYKQTKEGVDVVDKLCATDNCARATRRWPMVIFTAL